MNQILNIFSTILLSLVIVGVIRTIYFKTIQDRTVGLDILTTVSTGLLVLLSVLFDKSYLLDVTLIYAILSFAVVILIARYLERGI